MDDIRRRDLAVWGLQAVRPGMLVPFLFLSAVAAATGVWLAVPLLAIGWLAVAWVQSIPKRFRQRRFEMMWQACKDRRERLDQALKALRGSKVADLRELPQTIDVVASGLYQALRRADAVMDEITRSEGWRLSQRDPIPPAATDRQARALYDAAARSVLEYKDQVRAIMAGVERTEAQAAVFTAALDTLRVKMLGYRLVGRQLESPSRDFLEAMTEARMQLDSIDKALEELELTPFPVTITVMPEDAPERLLESGEDEERLENRQGS